MRVLRRGAPIAVLAIQNLLVFWGHYSGRLIFPFDFAMGYYAIVAFWTTAVSKGVFPQWVPFESMGYPLAINVQSAVHYPPFWLFPLLHIAYTLRAAVVVQCVHVLAGAIGTYALLKHYLGSPRYAVVGAVAFQFFGGFYSNSEHADIVRAFVLAPWLLYVFAFDGKDPRIERRALLIPLVVYLLATGGYPGNVLSTTFVLGVYVLLQSISGWLRGASVRHMLCIAASLLGLAAVGYGMAFIHLAPMWLMRDQLTRFEQIGFLKRGGLWFTQLPGLFLSNRMLPGEISMTSTYITLPVVVLATLVPVAQLRRHWTLAAIGLLSLLMVPGPKSPLWVVLTAIAPPLRFSRFPSSDYRIFVAIPIVIAAMLGLRAVLEGQLRRWDLATRVIIAPIWIVLGVSMTYRDTWDSQPVAAIAVGMASLALFLFLWRSRPGPSAVALAAVLSLVAIDGLRVLADMNTWRDAQMVSWIERQVPLERDNQLITYSIFTRELPTSRPPRQQTPTVNEFAWKGYLDGSYMMQDKGNTILRAREVVEANPLYVKYMLMGWTPLLVQPPARAVGGGEVHLTEAAFSGSLEGHGTWGAGGIEQTSYGINEIRYRVSLTEPTLVVENEVYFPGWQASLALSGQQQHVRAVCVNGVFRGWQLPAGDYEMKAHFEYPYLPFCRIVSGVSLALWLAIAVASRTQARGRSADEGSAYNMAR